MCVYECVCLCCVFFACVCASASGRASAHGGGMAGCSPSGGDAQVLKKQLELYAKELDDRYTQWELIRSDTTREKERTLLEKQLLSPMESAPETKNVQF